MFFLVFNSCNGRTEPNVEQKILSISDNNQTIIPEKKIITCDFQNNRITEISKVVLSILQDRDDNY